MKKLSRNCLIISLIIISGLLCGFNFNNVESGNVSNTLYGIEAEDNGSIIQPRYTYATVKANGLRVRSSASTSGTIVGLLYSGDKVQVDRTITNSTGTWCYIRAVSSGVSGYVSKQYLRFDE